MSPVPTSENVTNPVAGGNAPAVPPSGDPMQAGPRPTTVTELPTSALEFASKMFDHARTGNEDLISYLEAGLPPNLTNNRGDTLLMLACYHGHTALVKRMLSLSNPPDTNQLNGRGQSILAGVVFKSHDDLLPILIEAGADPLAGQPNAEDSAKMFNKWSDETKTLFEGARGRGIGARDAAPAVEDREEARRVPGQAAQTATPAQGGNGEAAPSADQS